MTPSSETVMTSKWEGAVTEVLEDTFYAHGIDMDSGEEGICHFYQSDVADEDRGLLTPGALFYWTIETEPEVSFTISFRRR